MLLAAISGSVLVLRSRVMSACNHPLARAVDPSGRYLAEVSFSGRCRYLSHDSTSVFVTDRSKYFGGNTLVLSLASCREVKLAWRGEKTLLVHYALPGSTPERITKLSAAGEVTIEFVPFNTFDGCPLDRTRRNQREQ